MRLLWVFFLIGSSILVAAQTNSYTLLDRKTHAPIPYATIKVLHTTKGEIANEKGGFQLQIEPADSVLITSIGYGQTTRVGRETGPVIYLDPITELLPNLVVRETVPVRTIILGNGKDLIHTVRKCRMDSKHIIDNCWAWGPAGGRKEEFAEKVILPDSPFVYRLLKIYAPTRKDDDYGPLLLRIYTVDSVSGRPGEELFVKRIEVKKRDLYKEKVLMDLSAEKIDFTGERAFYISLGWPPESGINSDHTILSLFPNNNGTIFQRSVRSADYKWSTMTLKNPEGNGRVTVGLSLAVEMEVRRYK